MKIDIPELTFRTETIMPHTYIIKTELKNIRCFKDFSVTLENEQNPLLWTMIIGNNSSGKTTLLRSIARGFARKAMQPV